MKRYGLNNSGNADSPVGNANGYKTVAAHMKGRGKPKSKPIKVKPAKA